MKKLLVATAVLALALSGCTAKSREKGKDAPIGARNDKPADVINFPDGFGNVAHKCGAPGQRVYVLYHGDSSYGSVTVVADPGCP